MARETARSGRRRILALALVVAALLVAESAGALDTAALTALGPGSAPSVPVASRLVHAVLVPSGSSQPADLVAPNRRTERTSATRLRAAVRWRARSAERRPALGRLLALAARPPTVLRAFAALLRGPPAAAARPASPPLR